MVILATLATIIASQAIITGAYSMTPRAIQLGWLSRLAVKQTLAEGYGQISVGGVKWRLMIVTVALALGFRKSDNLASAYGIAASLTMLLTTALLFIAIREIWRWNVALAAIVVGLFLMANVAFYGANVVKVAGGGYVPLLLACAAYRFMWLWHRGSEAVRQRYAEGVMPLAGFSAHTVANQTPRVPGTAVFLTRQDQDVPAVLIWHLLRNRSLHRNLVVSTFESRPVPYTRRLPTTGCR